MAAERKPFLIRVDPKVHEALECWAADELRSVNAQVEFVLRRALEKAGRLKERGPSGGEGAGGRR